MRQFAVLLRELRKWLTTFTAVRMLLPYSLFLLFGGLVILFLWELLLRMLPYSSYDALDVLFHRIPLYVLGYYGFFAGIWLTLISPEIKYLPYALWGYAFVLLFPFEYLGLQTVVGAIVYAAAGWSLYRYNASSAADRVAGSFPG